jgi:hypothetical protein
MAGIGRPDRVGWEWQYHRIGLAGMQTEMPENTESAKNTGATEIETHPVVVLSRYFLWFVALHEKFNKTVPEAAEAKFFGDIAFLINTMYMSNAYATLYVVIEGWHKLDLHDAEVDRLLTNSFVNLLRRFRHGVYHFQPKYFDNRLLDFINNGRSAIEWIRALETAFRNYFDKWHSEHTFEGYPKPPQSLAG